MSQLTPPDPYAIVELATDARPPDYCTEFVRLAVEYGGLNRPISVCACERAPWLSGVVAEMGVEVTNVAEALAFYAQQRAAQERRGFVDLSTGREKQ